MAELLMPEGDSLGNLGGKALDFDDDEETQTLAERYKVSQRVLLLRLLNVHKTSLIGS